jgi:hypothetical protein
MNIECFNRVNYSAKQKRYLLEVPLHKFSLSVYFYQYEVQKGEEMRLDLIMQSIYNDPDSYKDADVILYINGIDNPLNIRDGQIILYTDLENLAKFRYTEKGSTAKVQNIKQSLAVVNKSTRTDKNRTKFIEENYTLPPTVLNKSEPSVRIDSQSIIVGGLR